LIATAAVVRGCKLPERAAVTLGIAAAVAGANTGSKVAYLIVHDVCAWYEAAWLESPREVLLSRRSQTY
jgi:hypothetical protein